MVDIVATILLVDIRSFHGDLCLWAFFYYCLTIRFIHSCYQNSEPEIKPCNSIFCNLHYLMYSANIYLNWLLFSHSETSIKAWRSPYDRVVGYSEEHKFFLNHNIVFSFAKCCNCHYKIRLNLCSSYSFLILHEFLSHDFKMRF